MTGFLPGKLNLDILENLLKKHFSIVKDPRVVIGPKIGEDAAVIDFDDKYLVITTDPITFASDEIGWYAVNVNANDVAVMGAKPKWFLATILLPEKSDEKLAEDIFNQICLACKQLDVSLIGGHTEITYGLKRPIVVGTLVGEVSKDKLVTSSGAQESDWLILTKGIVIEGTSIMAREKENELKQSGFDDAFIKRAKNFLHSPGISVVREALLVNRFKVNSMHDPTEGGLATGIYELIKASNKGAIIYKEKIPVFPESERLCNKFNLDLMSTITSGSLLLTADPENAQKILSLYKREGIKAVKIGEIKEKEFGIKIKSGDTLSDLKIPKRDEITKLFC
jgi:thiamin-phosphate kinase